jgi:putative DNA primase/helicase
MTGLFIFLTAAMLIMTGAAITHDVPIEEAGPVIVWWTAFFGCVLAGIRGLSMMIDHFTAQPATVADTPIGAETPLPPSSVMLTPPTVMRADSVAARPIEWLWPDVIPLGVLTLIAGAPGMGKSQIAMAIAARVTKSGGNVLLCEAEDDIGAVIKPRSEAVGVDQRRVAFCGASFDLSEGIEALTMTVRRVFPSGVRLIVLSPARMFFDVAERRGNTGVRRALRPLLDWAARERVSIIGIGHPPKGKSDPFAGSGAYAQEARAVFSAVHDPADKNPIATDRRRLFVAVKANNGREPPALPYRIEGVTVGNGIQTSRVIFE